MKLHRFYFDFTDIHGEDNSVYVYAYNEPEAKKHFDSHIVEEYGSHVGDYEVTNEGEIDFQTEDAFFDKYDVVESREESGFIEKDSDNWDFVTKFANDNPDNIWSVYDSGEIVCGLHLIDVNGYYITVQSGNTGETYGYYEGMVAQTMPFSPLQVLGRTPVFLKKDALYSIVVW